MLLLAMQAEEKKTTVSCAHLLSRKAPRDGDPSSGAVHPPLPTSDTH